MLRLLADENLNGRILRALRRRLPELDLVRVQDTRLSGADDPAVLQFAADENRILITHDRDTLVGYAWDRVRKGHRMPGVLVAPTDQGFGPIIADQELLLLAGEPGDLDAQIVFLPL